MTCASCEVLVERKFKTIPGVRNVKVNHVSGKCRIYSEPNTTLRLSALQQLVKDKGYSVAPWGQHHDTTTFSVSTSSPSRTSLSELSVIFLILFAVYTLLKAFGIFSFSTNLDKSFSFGAIFVIGLVAATSTCIAVVGGLILSLSGKMNELQPNATVAQKFKLHMMFNAGRLISYFVLGGLIGVIGKAITPSPRFTGILTVVIAFVMIFLGIDILNLFKTKRFIPRMPKAFSHKIHALAEKNHPWVPAALGALTFFLPCGFTQSMQLYALTTGSFWKGGLTMLVFALGTLPALLGVGMVSSFTKGAVAQYFLKFSGALVLLLGLYNLNNGLLLTGVDAQSIFSKNETQTSETTNSVTLENGKQIVNMSVEGLKYVPSSFTIKKGIPVEWRVDGKNAAGCAGVITIPKMGIQEFLAKDKETIVAFTPTQAGTLPFTCSMGMTSGKFIVIES